MKNKLEYWSLVYFLQISLDRLPNVHLKMCNLSCEINKSKAGYVTSLFKNLRNSGLFETWQNRSASASLGSATTTCRSFSVVCPSLESCRHNIINNKLENWTKDILPTTTYLQLRFERRRLKHFLRYSVYICFVLSNSSPVPFGEILVGSNVKEN